MASYTGGRSRTFRSSSIALQGALTGSRTGSVVAGTLSGILIWDVTLQISALPAVSQTNSNLSSFMLSGSQLVSLGLFFFFMFNHFIFEVLCPCILFIICGCVAQSIHVELTSSLSVRFSFRLEDDCPLSSFLLDLCLQSCHHSFSLVVGYFYPSILFLAGKMTFGLISHVSEASEL